ncbi:unnamed protein product [Caenorhabditis angaria]|uniref:Rhodanese domain-containing protein n=1 Tax=Caenorhabditis angaria TaxID=860376 RepID=A0A9P1MZH1_9PELO|nr:unnamed protein product [Caenorhabditis angaria]
MAAVSSNYNLSNTITTTTSVIIDEDGDSRDSGISVSNCSPETETEIAITNPITNKPNEKVATHRHPLSDCSNLANKMLLNTSSRNSSFYHDTPTGRKTKSVFAMQDDSLDQSVYEKHLVESQLHDQKQIQRERCHSFELEETRSLTRKRSSSSSTSSTTSLRKRSRNLYIDSNIEDTVKDSEFFRETTVHQTKLSIPTVSLKNTLLQAKSLLNIAEKSESHCSLGYKRNASDDSFNDSSNRLASLGVVQVKTMRTMSVGAIGADPDIQLPNVLEVKYRLAAVEKPQKESQAFRSISPLTLLDEFEKLGEDFFSTFIIIDCRYPYEYQGGHIKANIIEKRIPIFYCEFSQKRGPAMAAKLRSLDRVRNELNYPHVEYPEIYLLDYGYRSLWSKEECRSMCEPQNYVPMDKPEFVKQLRTFRGARLRSNASVKSCIDLSISKKSEHGSLRKFSHRSLRKHESFHSIRSDLSTSLFNMSNDDVFSETSDKGSFQISRKWASVLNTSTAGSEVDVDVQLEQITTSTVSSDDQKKEEIKKIEPIKLLENLVAEERVKTEETENVVKLGLRIESPHFPQELVNTDGSSVADQPSPRTCLDFSSLSDTE